MQWQPQLVVILGLIGCRNYEPQAAFSGAQPVALSRSYIIPVGTIGIVSVQKETKTNYELKIIFPDLVATYPNRQDREPIRLRADDNISLNNSLQLFTASGSTVKVTEIPPIKLDRWCQNDGGYHYRSQVNITISKTQLAAPLIPTAPVEKFALFAVVGNLETVEPLTTPVVVITGTGRNQTTSKLVMEGKQSTTKRLVARVVERNNPLWAGCGDGLEQTSLVLETAIGASNLRCCGP